MTCYDLYFILLVYFFFLYVVFFMFLFYFFFFFFFQAEDGIRDIGVTGVQTCALPILIEAKITPRARAIMPVHLYGQSADLDPMLELAKAKNLVVIEDSCQAHGTLYKGKATGTIGQIGAYRSEERRVGKECRYGRRSDR